LSRCEAAGLQLCTQSCSGQGCSYDKTYVWTSIPCGSTPAPVLSPPPSPSPAASPPPPSPLSPPAPVSAVSGVLALQGRADDQALGECISTSSAAIATENDQPIAGQCCTREGGCRRRFSTNGEASTNNRHCLSGAYGGSTFAGMTYAETLSRCEAAGLQLCTQSCSGQGCSYDKTYVWTSIPCS